MIPPTRPAAARPGRRRVRALARLAAVAALASALVAAVVAGAPGRPAVFAQDTAPTPTPITFTVVGTTPSPTGGGPTTIAIAPTATPRPSPTPEPVALDFAADDWEGGYYQGNGRFYGRAWVAVYGALSDFPRAALTFDLPQAPIAPMAFEVEGLDDEWADRNEIALEINGRRVYEGPSPFQDFDGVFPGTNAAWTAVTVVIPPGLLTEGTNEIAVANLEPVASYNSPPYVLLSTASLAPAPPELVTAAAAAPTAAPVSIAQDDDGDDGDDDG
jgi:hypothetical protein